MTRAQRAFYWGGLRSRPPRNLPEEIGPWPAIARVRGIDPRSDAARYAVHRELGLPPSSADWGNEEFDRFLDAAISICGDLSIVDRGRTRLIHAALAFEDAISAIAGSVEYVERLRRDLGVGDTEAMPTPALTRWRNTLRSRLSRLLTAARRRGAALSVSNDILLARIASGQLGQLDLQSLCAPDAPSLPSAQEPF